MSFSDTLPKRVALHVAVFSALLAASFVVDVSQMTTPRAAWLFALLGGLSGYALTKVPLGPEVKRPPIWAALLWAATLAAFVITRHAIRVRLG